MPRKISDVVKERIAREGKQISLFDLFTIEDIVIKIRKKGDKE